MAAVAHPGDGLRPTVGTDHLRVTLGRSRLGNLVTQSQDRVVVLGNLSRKHFFNNRVLQ